MDAANRQLSGCGLVLSTQTATARRRCRRSLIERCRISCRCWASGEAATSRDRDESRDACRPSQRGRQETPIDLTRTEVPDARTDLHAGENQERGRSVVACLKSHAIGTTVDANVRAKAVAGDFREWTESPDPRGNRGTDCWRTGVDSDRTRTLTTVYST